MLKAGIFKILEIAGDVNPSDVFTKPLDGRTLAKYLNGICGYEDLPQMNYNIEELGWKLYV